MNLRRFLHPLTLGIFFFMCTGQVQAALIDVPDYNATVIPNGLNVRSGPGDRYGIIKVLKINESVRVTHNDGGWRKISLPGGAAAYVYGTYLRRVNTVAVAPPSPGNGDINVTDYTGRVKASSLRVRSGPNTSYSILGAQPNSSTVRVTHHNGIWRKISWRGGIAAYVHGDYVTPPTPARQVVSPSPSRQVVSPSACEVTLDTISATVKEAIRDRSNFYRDLITSGGAVAGACASGSAVAGIITGTSSGCLVTGISSNSPPAFVSTVGGGLGLGGSGSIGAGGFVSNAPNAHALAGSGLCLSASGGIVIGAEGVVCSGLVKNRHSCSYSSNGIYSAYFDGGAGLGISVAGVVTTTTVSDITTARLRRGLENVRTNAPRGLEYLWDKSGLNSVATNAARGAGYLWSKVPR